MDLDQLKKIKEETQKKNRMRKTEADKKITVCMGTCGIAAGAKPVLNAFLKEVNEQDLEDVMVTQTGCIGLCSREPVALVTTKEEEVTYGDLTPEKAKRIVEKHLIENEVVEEYVIASE